MDTKKAMRVVGKNCMCASDARVGKELGREGQHPVTNKGLHAFVGKRRVPNEKGIGSRY